MDSWILGLALASSVGLVSALCAGVFLYAEKAELWGTIGNSKEIKNISCFGTYSVAYTKTHLQIGCKNYLISRWRAFKDHHIHAMGGEIGSLFWKTNKDIILRLILENPAS